MSETVITITETDLEVAKEIEHYFRSIGRYDRADVVLRLVDAVLEQKEAIDKDAEIVAELQDELKKCRDGRG